MKIVYVIVGLGVGGAETQLTALSTYMAERGHDVTIIALSDLNLVQVDSRVEIIRLHVRKSALSLFKGFVNLCRCVNTLRPDVLHSHMIHANLLCRAVRLCVGVPKLFNTIHSIVETDSAIALWAYRLTAFIPTRVTFVSNAALLEHRTRRLVRGSAAIVLHNAVDVRRFTYDAQKRDLIRQKLGISNEVIALMSVGRFVEIKNYSYLVDKFRELKVRCQERIELVMVGDGPLRESLESRCRSDSILRDSVHFVGNQSDIAGYMSASDVFVHLSRREGFGLVVAEAMACGRFVVSAKNGGSEEVLGDVGILVDLGREDAFVALRDAVAMSDQQRSNDGVDGRRRVEALFSLEAIATEWERLYER